LKQGIRHAGLDPASTFFLSGDSQKKGGPRIKSGVTILLQQDKL
jgi:hypothetical protein